VTLGSEVQAWLAEDPDPDTRAELEGLLAAGDEDALRERFSGRLQFGTAGLRGPLGAGPMRMNRLLVRRTAMGLLTWLRDREVPGPLVVGYDARHGSRAFADDTVAAAAIAGRDAVLLPGPLPTPVLAFAVRHLAAAGGVMVTASHNPAADNGYKVYDETARQIVPPADAEISAAIDAVVLADSWPPARPLRRDDVVDAYVAAAGAASLVPDARDVRIAATPMHGVGGALLQRVLTAHGFEAPTLVPAQAEPDPDFPTVVFPNPEEPGAMDLLLAWATDRSADVAIANDPDADRMAAAVPLPAGGWRVLTGDEVGALLAHHVLSHTSGPGRVVATTIVSSSLLAAQAAAAGARFERTLTGFKWLARVPRPGECLVYAYEEALGHSVGGIVHDKDGLTAALAFAELVAVCKAEGGTVLDVLADLDARFGAHATGQVSVRTSSGAALVARLLADPPVALGEHRVADVVDLSTGWEGLPPTDGIVLVLERGRVIVRPSGTEPKVKCYLEVVDPSRGVADAALAELRGAAAGLLAP
jgi:phosphomannomutase